MGFFANLKRALFVEVEVEDRAWKKIPVTALEDALGEFVKSQLVTVEDKFHSVDGLYVTSKMRMSVYRACEDILKELSSFLERNEKMLDNDFGTVEYSEMLELCRMYVNDMLEQVREAMARWNDASARKAERKRRAQERAARANIQENPEFEDFRNIRQSKGEINNARYRSYRDRE